jgi:hypothetical protein
MVRCAVDTLRAVSMNAVDVTQARGPAHFEKSEQHSEHLLCKQPRRLQARWGSSQRNGTCTTRASLLCSHSAWECSTQPAPTRIQRCESLSLLFSALGFLHIPNRWRPLSTPLRTTRWTDAGAHPLCLDRPDSLTSGARACIVAYTRITRAHAHTHAAQTTHTHAAHTHRFPFPIPAFATQQIHLSLLAQPTNPPRATRLRS